MNVIDVYNTAAFYWTSRGTGSFHDSTTLNPVYFPGISDIENGFVNHFICITGISPCEPDTIFIPLFIQKSPFVFAGEHTPYAQMGAFQC